MSSVTPFGTTATGRPVQAITLQSGALTARILTWGAVIQSVRLAGVAHDLTLGSDVLADYEGAMRHHGSVIGPVVNRLRDARAVLDGQNLRFEANLAGKHCIHGGSAGTQLKVWDLVEAGPAHCVLALDLPDGEGGFPGNRRVEARFSVEGAVLRQEITTTTDAPTIFNATNHSYWNLDGTPTFTGHTLRIDADSYLPTDDLFLVTGEVLPLDGTPLDFRAGRAIEPGAPAFDNCFCLSDARQPLRPVLWLTGQSGVTMEVATTEPGVQIYDARGAIRPGGRAYEGVAVECQGWPDAPNNPHFPSVRLDPGAALRQVTEWRFGQG